MVGVGDDRQFIARRRIDIGELRNEHTALAKPESRSAAAVHPAAYPRRARLQYPVLLPTGAVPPLSAAPHDTRQTRGARHLRRLERAGEDAYPRRDRSVCAPSMDREVSGGGDGAA